MKNYVPLRNGSGCPEPTAQAALININREDEEAERRKNALIAVLKYIIDQSGYDLLARIEIKDRKTGKNYR